VAPTEVQSFSSSLLKAMKRGVARDENVTFLCPRASVAAKAASPFSTVTKRLSSLASDAGGWSALSDESAARIDATTAGSWTDPLFVRYIVRQIASAFARNWPAVRVWELPERSVLRRVVPGWLLPPHAERARTSPRHMGATAICEHHCVRETSITQLSAFHTPVRAATP
jgi:hypothetical protein